MAILKQRLLREGASGTFDTIHLETASGLVVRPNGTTVEDSLVDLSSKKFDKTGGSISGQVTITRPINNAGVIINPSAYPTDGGAACIGKSPNGGFVLTPVAKTVKPSVSPVVLHGIDTPQFDNDAANKAYVDSSVSNSSFNVSKLKPSLTFVKSIVVDDSTSAKCSNFSEFDDDDLMYIAVLSGSYIGTIAIFPVLRTDDIANAGWPFSQTIFIEGTQQGYITAGYTNSGKISSIVCTKGLSMIMYKLAFILKS